MAMRFFDREHSPFRRENYLMFLMVAGAALFMWSNAVVDIDDAPITYRYAQNLADGKGFVYNEGEYIQGTTTPLYTIVLALLHKFSGMDIAGLSNFLNLLFSVATVVLTYKVALILANSAGTAFLAGAFLITLGPFVAWSMAGMETPFYTFLLVACLYFYFRRRYFPLGVFGGLLVVARVDGLVLMGFLGLLMTAGLATRKIAAKEYLAVLAPFLLISAAWFMFAYFYFGAVLPHSLSGKQAHGKVASEWWPVTHFFQLRYLFLLPALLLTCFIGTRDKKYANLVLPAFATLYLSAYLAADLDFYEWYIVPLMPIFAILFVCSLEPLKSRAPLRIGVFGFFLLVNIHFCHENVNRLKIYINDQFEVNRVAAGKWLHDNVSEEASLGVGAIGHLGWHFKGRIIDYSWLVTARDDASQADVIMTSSPPPPPAISEKDDPRLKGYAPIKSFPHPVAPLHIWIKKDKTFLLQGLAAKELPLTSSPSP